MGEEKKKEKKPAKTEKPAKEPSTRELLETIQKQQETMSKQTEEIGTIKEHFNKLVDAFSELGESIEKGAGGKGGGLGEIATVIKAVAPLLRGRESSPFEAIGVYTFKQFLRTTMGKKMGKKAIKQMFTEEKEEEEKEEKEE